MENRLHQRRVSFSDSHSPKHHGSSDKTLNWLPRITSHDDYIRDDEYVTSVAATAFAIHSLEEAELRDLQKMRKRPQSSRPRTVRREEDGISKRPSNGNYNGETSMKRSPGQDPRTKETAFPVRRPSGTSSPRPVSPALGYPMQQGIPLPHKKTKTKPETCESALKKMIYKQYEIMKSKILSWEFVKTIQAKVQGTRKMQNYRSKVIREDMGARAGLEGRRRKESEARKNSIKNRKTSKVLVKCLSSNC